MKYTPDAPRNPKPAMNSDDHPSVTTAAIWPTMIGPDAPPMSPISRQTPMNSLARCLGARSAPSVIIAPLLSPFPNPVNTAIAPKVQISPLSGSNAIPAPRTRKLGIDMYLRPYRSIA